MAWTSPRTWLAGETVTAALLNTHLRDNLKALGDPWAAYTPTWAAATTNPTLGNGTLTGVYMQTGKLVAYRFRLTVGSTTAVGSGEWFFGLPVAGNSDGVDPGGSGIARDSSAGTYSILVPRLLGATVGMLTTSGRVTDSAPFVWAAGDTVSGGGVYEAV